MNMLRIVFTSGEEGARKNSSNEQVTSASKETYEWSAYEYDDMYL